MQTSEEQFPHLLADLTARLKKILANQPDVPCMGLILRKEANIEVVLGLTDDTIGLAEVLNAMQEEIIDQIKTSGGIATCIAYPDYPNNQIVALLENEELYCMTCEIRIVKRDGHLIPDLENLEIKDGAIHIFGDPT